MVEFIKIEKHGKLLVIETSWFATPFEYEYEKDTLFCNPKYCRVTLYLCILFDRLLNKETKRDSDEKTFTALDYNCIFREIT